MQVEMSAELKLAIANMPRHTVTIWVYEPWMAPNTYKINLSSLIGDIEALPNNGRLKMEASEYVESAAWDYRGNRIRM